MKRNRPNDLNKMISKVYGCKMYPGRVTSIQLKLKVVEGVCNIRVRNHQTFQNLCAESLKVHVRNHQDNSFNKRSIQKWRQPDKWTRVNIWKMKVQHLVSLFTLFPKKFGNCMLGIKPQLQHKGGEDVASFVTTWPGMLTYFKMENRMPWMNTAGPMTKGKYNTYCHIKK